MIALFLVLLSIASVFFLINRFFADWELVSKIGISLVLGIIFLGITLFCIYGLWLPIFNYPLIILSIFFFIFVCSFWLGRKSFKMRELTIGRGEVLLIFILFVFSFWLMFSSFSYKNNNFEIGSHLWSDYGSHVALMRSFSLGDNFPPEFPLFPNENIRYHFMFYFLAGALERLGSNLVFGFNLISALSFWAMGLLIYSAGKTIFNGQKIIGFIAVLLTLFNGSLIFLSFFQKHSPLEIETYKLIISNHSFLANAPYEQSDLITTFWHLNIYLSQRHLALGFAAALFVVLIFYRTFVLKKINHFQFLIGILTVLVLPFWHAQVFLMTVATAGLISMFFFNRSLLKIYLICFLFFGLSFIQTLWFKSNNFPVAFDPGYLLPRPITVLSFLDWWFRNLGLSFLLIADALLIVNRQLRRFYCCFLSIFLIGFFLRFSPDVATNHKFFNFFQIITNLFIANFLLYLWVNFKTKGKVLTLILFFPLILSGVLEFFPVVNDSKINIKDWKLNDLGLWVKNNTSKKAIFLTSFDLYHPVSLVGRKVFLGWPYFAWSAGLDTDNRGKVVREIYTGKDKKLICYMLSQNNIQYVLLEGGHEEKLYWQNKDFFDNNFSKVFEEKLENRSYTVYDINYSCSSFF